MDLQNVLDLFNFNDKRQGMIVWSFLPALLGVGLYFLLIKMDKVRFRFLSFIPLVLGLLLGIFAVMQLRDPLYVDYYWITSRSRLLYWGILVMPILTAAGLLIYDRMQMTSMDSRL